MGYIYMAVLPIHYVAFRELSLKVRYVSQKTGHDMKVNATNNSSHNCYKFHVKNSPDSLRMTNNCHHPGHEHVWVVPVNFIPDSTK